jgi:uncharacterized phage protein gp47/JayE
MVNNRPGLASISYRVGTYGAFRQAMIHAISRFPELSTWAVRTSDDHGIAWIEMWAYLADILTFYQERIANEAYLRTAILPESAMRLAALLDYRLVPGVAASTYLAFMLEKDKEVKIPSGLRVQSVPGQGEKPQKFETVQSIFARADINRLRIYPYSKSHNPFEKGNPVGNGTIGYLDPGSKAALSPGDMFVILSKSVSGIFSIEDKEVVGFKQDDGLTALVWKPEIQTSDMYFDNSHAFKFVQKYRLFGHNAPNRYLHSYPDNNGDVKWIWVKEGDPANNEIGKPEYTFKISSGRKLNLDAVYDDLKKGTEILISVNDPNGTVALVTWITDVRQVSVSYGPMSAAVSEITINDPITGDLREIEIYKLDGEISFLSYCYPDNITGKSFCLPSNQAEKIDLNRVLIIGDKDKATKFVTVTGIGSVVDKGLRSISIDWEISPSLDSKTAFIYGNIAGATHGETVNDEVLGDGDASADLQSFQISKFPVTFVHQAKAPLGAANTLQIRVDGILWHEASSFYGRAANERIYTSEIDAEGKTVVRFGDGQNGARLPSGSGNVTATYRKGSGKEGIVKANTLKTLLDRPLGLKSVINPFEAEGGDDREGLEDVRKNAPNTVRTFDRIVSLRDFEDAAREFKGYVAKAKSTWYWDGEEQAVLLTVAGVHDKDPSPFLPELIDYLNVRRDRNRKLRVSACRKMPVQMILEIFADSDYLDKDVRMAVTRALNDHLAFENLNLGQSIHLSDLYQAIQSVAGVVASHITMLQFKGLSDSELKKRLATFKMENGISVWDSVQNHLYISSEELIVVENPDADIVVNIWSGQQ